MPARLLSAAQFVYHDDRSTLSRGDRLMMARFAFRDCCKNGDRHLETRSQSPFLQQILTLLSIAIVQAGMAAEPARQVTIRWHGQSFFEVESSKGTHVVFDPHAIEAFGAREVNADLVL